METTMSSRKPKRPTGYRKPAPAEEPRRGILGGFLQPRAAVASPMPKAWRSYARGLMVVLGAPAILVAVPVVLLLQWLVLIAIGFQGPFTLLAGTFEWPGPGTLADTIVSASVATSSASALIGLFVMFILRGALLAFATTAAVERLRTGGVTTWALRRGLRVLPVTIAANLMGFALLQVGQIATAFLAQAGLGVIAFIAAMVATVYLTAYAPAIAADESRTMPASMQRGIRTARMPGSGSLIACAVYTIAAFAVNVAYLPSSGIGVNPSIASWAGVLVANLLSLGVVGMFAYRYLSVASFVEDPPPAPRRRG
jgi:hypothetical protein